MLLLVSLRMYCDTTSHSPHSKSCPPPPANGTCNALELSPPCEYFVGVGEYLLGNAVFVYLLSSHKGDDAPLVFGILAPLGFAHYRLPLQKQWQTPHSHFSVFVEMETQL